MSDDESLGGDFDFLLQELDGGPTEGQQRFSSLTEKDRAAAEVAVLRQRNPSKAELSTTAVTITGSLVGYNQSAENKRTRIGSKNEDVSEALVATKSLRRTEINPPPEMKSSVPAPLEEAVEAPRMSSDEVSKVAEAKERNKSHARSTRLRKKEHFEYLKATVSALHEEAAKVHVEKRNQIAKTMDRRRIVHHVLSTALHYRGCGETRRHVWENVLDEAFVLTLPSTPYRFCSGAHTAAAAAANAHASSSSSSSSVSRARVGVDTRKVVGIEEMAKDSASLSVLLQAVGPPHFRGRWPVWGVYLLGENSVAGAEGPRGQHGVSAAEARGRKSGAEGRAPNDPSCQRSARSGCAKSAGGGEGVRSTGGCGSGCGPGGGGGREGVGKTVDACGTSEEQGEGGSQGEFGGLMLSGSVAMTRWSMHAESYPSPQAAHLAGSGGQGAGGAQKVGCFTQGMLTATMSPQNKLVSLELCFDVMGFMQQLPLATATPLEMLVAEVPSSNLEEAVRQSKSLDSLPPPMSPALASSPSLPELSAPPPPATLSTQFSPSVAPCLLLSQQQQQQHQHHHHQQRHAHGDPESSNRQPFPRPAATSARLICKLQPPPPDMPQGSAEAVELSSRRQGQAWQRRGLLLGGDDGSGSTVVHANRAWLSLSGYSARDLRRGHDGVEDESGSFSLSSNNSNSGSRDAVGEVGAGWGLGVMFREVVCGPETDPRAIACLVNEVRGGRAASAMIASYTKTGRRFANYVRIFPLTANSLTASSGVHSGGASPREGNEQGPLKPSASSSLASSLPSFAAAAAGAAASESMSSLSSSWSPLLEQPQFKEAPVSPSARQKQVSHFLCVMEEYHGADFFPPPPPGPRMMMPPPFPLAHLNAERGTFGAGAPPLAISDPNRNGFPVDNHHRHHQRYHERSTTLL